MNNVIDQDIELTVPHSKSYTMLSGYSFSGFEAKIRYIIENEMIIPDDASNADFFCNHFIMTDFEARQLKGFIMSQGMTSFHKLLDRLSKKMKR
jgi:hypothetical protein